VAEPFEYMSRSRLVYKDGLRNAYLGDVPEPVVYGVQGKLREYYGAREGPPIASTLGPHRSRRRGLNVRHTCRRAVSAQRKVRSLALRGKRRREDRGNRPHDPYYRDIAPLQTGRFPAARAKKPSARYESIRRVAPLTRASKTRFTLPTTRRSRSLRLPNPR